MTKESFWKKALLQPGALISDAITVLSETALRIVLVVDENLRLLGTVTDGDIRRALLKDLRLNIPILEVTNKNPIVVNQSVPKADVLRIMSANKVYQVPVVGEDLKIIGLHLWDELSSPSSRDNSMIIMAGGKGSRLYPQTEKLPKPMLLVFEKPILEHIIKRAQGQGFNHFIISINYLGQIIENYFKNGEKIGTKIEYLREDVPLGTAGALSLLQNKPTNSFIVTNGDVLTDINYSDLLDYHDSQNADATVVVHNHEYQIPYGVVQINGIEIESYIEKPIVSNFINAGVYAFKPIILDFIKESKFRNMPEVLEILRNAGKRVIVYPLHESWMDVGRPKDLESANKRKIKTD